MRIHVIFEEEFLIIDLTSLNTICQFAMIKAQQKSSLYINLKKLFTK